MGILHSKIQPSLVFRKHSGNSDSEVIRYGNQLSLSANYLATYSRHMPAWGIKSNPTIVPAMENSFFELWHKTPKSKFYRIFSEKLQLNPVKAESLISSIVKSTPDSLFTEYTNLQDTAEYVVSNVLPKSQENIRGKVFCIFKAFISSMEEAADDEWNAKTCGNIFTLASFCLYLVLPALIHRDEDLISDERPAELASRRLLDSMPLMESVPQKTTKTPKTFILH